MSISLFSEPVSEIEISKLAECEAVIERGLKTFVDVGNALLEIRDSKLYRGEFDTFEDYCRGRWNISRPRAYQLIEAAQTISGLSTIVDILPSNEAQVRPIASLPPQEQVRVWEQVVDTAPSTGITAAHVQSVMDKYKRDHDERYIENPNPVVLADKEADQGRGLTEKEWKSRPDSYLGTCHKQCYAPRVMEKGDVFEYGVRGVYVCSGCGYAYPPGHEPNEAALGDDKDAIEERVKPHVANNSGNNEWYTPEEYILAARAVLGEIDLDPASSDIANQTVRADVYYTAENDGLSRDWAGRVWMNPPYASELIGRFCDKLARHFADGDVSQALVLVNNATETGWFQTLLTCSSAVCFIRRRVKFIDMNGNPSGAPLQGQAILYLGDNPQRFSDLFSQFGVILYGQPGHYS